MAIKQQKESDIRNLSGLQAIRAKISMYAGGSDGTAQWTCIREPLDNVIDEASAGRNKMLHLIRTGPLSFWVIDQGGGLPVGSIKVENPVTHKMETISALKAQVGLIHSGGKFDLKEEDGGMRGTHGVGIKLSNAASNVFAVYTFRTGQWWKTEYKKGKETVAVVKCAAPKLPVGKAAKGTCIYIELDPTVFDKGAAIDPAEIMSWFTMTAAFGENLKMTYTDEDGESTEWECEGPEAYLDSKIEEYKASPVEEDAKIIAKGKLWDLALSFTDLDGIGVEGFANGLLNKDGGAHVTAVFDAIATVVTPYAKRGTGKFNPTDLRDGLLGVINIKLTGIKFHNQEKSKVTDDRAGAPLRDEIIPHLEEFFQKRPKLAALLCERASNLLALKSEFQKNKRVMKVLKDAKRKGALPNKLASSMNCTNEERELFLVEGDSAGGSAKKARDARYQEVLPLKGKFVNAFGPKASVAIENEEVLAILTAIGYDPSLEEPFQNLRVGRLIILTDADVDGLHIQNIILASLIRFVPEMINEGRVYVAQRYEYMVTYKDQYWFAETREELEGMVPKAAYGFIKHLKGLGEIDSEPLADMAFNPEKRKLTKLLPMTRKDVQRISELAGTDASHRKELLGV